VEEVDEAKRERKKNVQVLRPRRITKLPHGKAKRERERERERFRV
jgi:hypothetical protein